MLKMLPNGIFADLQNKLRSLTVVYNNLDSKINNVNKLIDDKVNEFESKYSIDDIQKKIDEINKNIEDLKLENEIKNKSIPSNFDPIAISSAFGTMKNNENKQFDKFQNRLLNNELRSNLIENKLDELDKKIESKIIDSQLNSKNEISKINSSISNIKEDMINNLSNLNKLIEEKINDYEIKLQKISSDSNSREIDNLNNKLDNEMKNVENLKSDIKKELEIIKSINNLKTDLNQGMDSIKINEKINNDIQSIKSNNEKINNEISILKNRFDENKSNNNLNSLSLDNLELKLSNKLDENKNDIQSIKSNNEKINNEISILKNRFDEKINNEISNLSNKLDENKNDIQSIKSNNEKINNEISILKNRFDEDKSNNNLNSLSLDNLELKLSNKINELDSIFIKSSNLSELENKLINFNEILKNELNLKIDNLENSQNTKIKKYWKNLRNSINQKDEKINELDEKIKSLASESLSDEIVELMGDNKTFKFQMESTLEKLKGTDERLNQLTDLIQTVISMQKPEDIRHILQTDILKDYIKSIDNEGKITGKIELDVNLPDIYFVKNKSNYLSYLNLAKNKIGFCEKLIDPSLSLNINKSYPISNLSLDKIFNSMIMVNSPDNSGIYIDYQDGQWIDMITPYYNPLAKNEKSQPSETYLETVLNEENKNKLLNVNTNFILIDPINQLYSSNIYETDYLLHEIFNMNKKKPEFKYISNHIEKSGKISTVQYPFRAYHLIYNLSFNYNPNVKLDVKDLNLLINDVDVINKFNLIQEKGKYILKAKSAPCIFDNFTNDKYSPLTICIKNKGLMMDATINYISGKIRKMDLKIVDSPKIKIANYFSNSVESTVFNLLESSKCLSGRKLKDLNIKFTVIYHNINYNSYIEKNEILNCIKDIKSDTSMKYQWDKNKFNVEKSDNDIKLTGTIIIKPEKSMDSFKSINVFYEVPLGVLNPTFISIEISKIEINTEGFLKIY